MGVELEINQVKSEIAEAQSRSPGDFSVSQVATSFSQSTADYKIDESSINGAENYSAAKAGVKTGLNALTLPVDPVGAMRRQSSITKEYAAEQKSYARMHRSNENEIKEKLSQIKSELQMQLAMRSSPSSSKEPPKNSLNPEANPTRAKEQAEG